MELVPRGGHSRWCVARPLLRCRRVWIKIHTTAVVWNLFHAEATRVGAWQGLSCVVAACGLKSTLRLLCGTCSTRQTPASPGGRRAVLRGVLVWIKIHTTAVVWNLFHAEAIRVGVWQCLSCVGLTCGLKSTLRLLCGTCSTQQTTRVARWTESCPTRRSRVD